MPFFSMLKISYLSLFFSVELTLRYDKKDVFFYLDPPYYGSEKYYQVQFSEDEHIKLAEMLKQVKGKFLLSYNDCDYVRELYSQFNIEAVERFSSLSLRYEKGDSK